MHDRLLYLLARSIGKSVTVTVASGQRFKGVLSGASTSSDLGVVLSAAYKIDPIPGMEDESLSSSTTTTTTSASSAIDPASVKSKLVIQPKDCVDVLIDHVALSSPQLPPPGFRTDTDISSARTSTPFRDRERELERWSPGVDDLGSSASLGALEDTSLNEPLSVGSAGAGSTSFDQFHANKQRFGIHSTYDEHLYTTVIDKAHPEYRQREARAERIAAEITASGYQGNIHIAEERGLVVDDSGADEEDKYSGVERRAPAAKQPPKLVERLEKHTLRDPAIISSSLAKPSSGDGVPSTSVASAAPAGAAEESKTVASSPSIETELVGNFRQFVNNEAERVKLHKSQFWQHREKNERIHDFKKFSEDYKIKTPVPPDLVPILTKNKTKQEELLKPKPKPKFNFSASFTPKTSFAPASASPSAAASVPLAPHHPPPPQQFSPSVPMASPPQMAGVARLPSPQQVPLAPVTASQSSSATPDDRSQSPANDFFAPGRSSKSKKNWKAAFNPFITYKKMEKPIEPAYATPPTWAFDIDQSYTQVLAEIVQNAPRGPGSGLQQQMHQMQAQSPHQQPQHPMMAAGVPFPGAPGAAIPPQMLNFVNMQMGMNMNMDLSTLQAMQNMQGMAAAAAAAASMPMLNPQALGGMAPPMMPMYGGAGGAGVGAGGMRMPQAFSPTPPSGGATPLQHGSPLATRPTARPPHSTGGPRPVVMSPQPSNGQYYSPQMESK